MGCLNHVFTTFSAFSKVGNCDREGGREREQRGRESAEQREKEQRGRESVCVRERQREERAQRAERERERLQ